MVRGTFDKMNQVIVHYSCLLNEIKIPVQANEADKLELIKNRMKDLSLTMDIDKYKFLMFDEFNFRRALDYCNDDPNISADQLYNNAISILPEKEYPNYYDNILENIWQLMIQQFPNYLQEKISILSYIKAYDELEIKANNWMEILKQLSIFQLKNVEFTYRGIEFIRERMLMSLQEAENSGDNIIFPTSFNPDTDVIVQTHLRLLYIHFATDGVLTSNECYTIFEKYYSNSEQTFYQLFEGLDIEIQKKLEQIIINPFLVNEMSLNQEEYLQENTQNLGYGQVMPIQKRHGLVQFILNGCNLIVKQGNY
uniref:Uncharacterized protein n=1 Tax=Meloidogyne enterolobii TaxID=390850 RepID=A0A6V7UMD8_MELEN|nr:unnamed protein product [Meloidogyne enterolobii]